MGGVGRYHGKIGKAEVRHGTCDGANVEGVAGRDEHYVDAIALGFREQRMIVVPLSKTSTANSCTQQMKPSATSVSAITLRTVSVRIH